MSGPPFWERGDRRESEMIQNLSSSSDDSAIRSADPKNHTLEPNMKWIGWPVAEIWPFAYLGAYGTPIWGEGEVIGGQRWHHLKDRWWFPIALHCDRCAICNHLAVICDRMSPTLKSTGGGSIWTQISGCSPWIRSMMFGSIESERPTLTKFEIIFEEFQPTWS